ncbi:alpha-keto acid decarboxylase family protein [Kocuria sp.]|uniref:alpha-keto acid decarboxylase family protein n=1 Tax=Kocuria sp. TaxID=1871328 RepID=UPI0026E09588|nr:thiamine pyrophosphate-binding protein [Kocuria sp.]MDO5618505.1 thiamine pyrophosphate-binding protein [Kocuria sp.]
MNTSVDTAHTAPTVGQYLAQRLTQLGATNLFGLPGDFNLTLLDQMLTVEELQWVGSTNELNASYAADAYARAGRGVGAFVTTFGVGELSAVNGMAGSYAEDVPVVHIVGMPSRAAMEQGVPLHHTLLDGDFEHGLRVAREFTVADAVLRPESAAREIDRVLTAVLSASKPGFIGVPLDVAAAMVQDASDPQPLTVASTRPDVLAAFERALRDHVARCSQATLLAGPRIHRRGLESVVRQIAELPGVQVASQSASKAILDERHPASLGTYLGKTTADPATRDAVDQAELLIMVGTITSDFTTGFFSHKYVPEEAVELALDHARIAHAHYPGVMLHDALEVLQRVIGQAEFAALEGGASSSVPSQLSTTHAAEDAALTHELFWPEIQNWIAPQTTVIAEAGTSFYGALDLQLPADSDLLGQPVWSSIGYTLPAVLGAGLAQPQRRPVLFIGDGSAQLTVQELGTIFQRIPNSVTFLIENRGYTVERYIQSPDAVYQDVITWDWPAIPAVLGAPHVHTPRVGTVGELRAVLAESAANRDASYFITVDLPERDAPRLLKVLAEGIAATNTAT